MNQETKAQLALAIQMWGGELAQEDESGKYVLISKETAQELDSLMKLLEKDAASARTGPKRVRLPPWQELQARLVGGTNLRALAKEYRCSRQTIRNRIEEGLAEKFGKRIAS